MLAQDEFKKALENAIKQAGSQTLLAQRLGMTQSQISDYLRGRFQVENMTIGNLYKLFPNASITLEGVSRTDTVQQTLEDELLTLYRSLSPEQQVRCLAIVAANFPEKIKAEAKK